MGNLKSVRKIKLEKVRFLRNNTIGIFLNENLIELDFSQNDLSNTYEKFGIMTNIEILILRNVNLQSMEKIYFQNFLKLKKLDLSFNNLTRLDYGSFKNLKLLEYLDLSFNQIDFIDGRIFGDWGDLKPKTLMYLNLESNRIKNFNGSLCSLVYLKILILTNNELTEYPLITYQLKGTFNFPVSNFYFNQNKLKSFSLIKFDTSSLFVLDFSFNQISNIESNALDGLKLLQNFSLSNNLLKNITKENFLFQSKLLYFNLSCNRIGSIELNSFQNLIELKELDLSFNRLFSIDNNLFNGLVNLNDLYLLNNFSFSLFNHSFNYLINIGNIYLTRSMIQENKCLFMHSIERKVKRNVADGKYKFFKSINLISNDLNDLTQNEYCELTFDFLQFKIHWNLKSDYENEIFFEKCTYKIMEKKNNFNHSLKSCFQNLQFIDKNDDKETENLKLNVFNDGLYLLTMALLILFLLPFFVYVYLNLFYEPKIAFKIDDTFVLTESNLQSENNLKDRNSPMNGSSLSNVITETNLSSDKSFHLIDINPPGKYMIYEESFNCSNYLKGTTDENIREED